MRWPRSTVITLVMLAGGCFAIVVATHVCERFHLLPFMGWGQPSSIGHYIDLTAALLGLACALLAGGIAVVRRSRVH